MSLPNDSQKTSGWWIIPAAFVLLALYVLSIGPLAWLERNEYLGNDRDHPLIRMLRVIYYPLLQFEGSEWFRWYVGLWV